MATAESAAIEQARRQGYLLVQRNSGQVNQLLERWQSECSSNGQHVIAIVQDRKQATLFYVLSEAQTSGWSETLRRDIEGFLLIEFRSIALESHNLDYHAVFSSSQGRIEGLKMPQAIHFANRLASVASQGKLYERNAESAGLTPDRVLYIGAHEHDPDKVRDVLQRAGMVVQESVTHWPRPDDSQG